MSNAAANAVTGAVNEAQRKRETFTFTTIPRSVADLKALPESDLSTPFKTCALTMLVLLNYADDVNATIEMLNFLKGPEPMNTYQIQFLKERLAGKEYVVRSFFEGSSPQNNYIPTEPLKITVFDNPYSYPEAGWATLHMNSTGADSPRQIKCRLKPSTNQWFLVENLALSDIRTPVAADPWA
ncbi:MAG: hypothetical protein J6X97_06610 [Lachnospiraceae bacterium]|nr:hypothetical protein [Lachnospiraceae bacterium]